MKTKKVKTKIFLNSFAIIFALSVQATALEDSGEPKIIQPGPPGSYSKILDAEDASNIANTSYTVADVKFLQGMIVHHEQAVLMSSYVESRTNNKTILDLAKRIDVSQVDEINFMESWLKARNEVVSMDHMDHGNDMNMAGMHQNSNLKN